VRILGIETSTARSSVALLDGARVRTHLAHVDPRGHGAFLAPAVRRALDAADGPVDAVAVGVGPGLYTGLRVGMATAAAYAAARRIPVVGVGGLDALAAARSDAGGAPADGSAEAVLVTTLDARRGQWFWAVHAGDPPQRVEGPHVGPRERLDADVARLATTTTVHVIGEAAVDAGAEPERPDATDTARLAAARLAAVPAEERAATFTPASLRPLYLRDADVRIGWDVRGGRGGGGGSA
jgi:tRNA threonylcarbamoyl adenosine modification protein YeaZ